MKLNRVRLLFELPFFLVYLSAYHVSSRTIHDVFAHLKRDSRMRLLGELRKVASLYLRFFAESRDTVKAILATASKINVRELEVFLRNYAATIVSRGGVQPLIERGLETSIRALDSLVNNRLEIILSAIEAIAITSTILVFTIAFIPVNQALTLLLSIILSLTMVSLSITLQLPLLEVYIGRPSRAEKIMGYTYITLSLATGIILVYTQPHIRSLGGLATVLLAAAPLPLGLYFFNKWRHMLKTLDKDIESTTLVLDNLQLGSSSLETLVKSLRQAVEQKTLVAAIVFGRIPQTRHTQLLEYSANLITVLLMSGAQSAQTAAMFSLVLDRVRALQRLLNTRALIYEAIVFGSLLGLVTLSYLVSQTLDSMTAAASLTSELMVPFSIRELDASRVASILYFPVFTAILAISKITRGEPFYTPILGAIPLTLAIILATF